MYVTQKKVKKCLVPECSMCNNKFKLQENIFLAGRTVQPWNYGGTGRRSGPLLGTEGLLSWNGPMFQLLDISPEVELIFNGPGIWLLLLNARSICNKASLIHDLNMDEKANLAYISENWMWDVALSEICPAMFWVWHHLRLQDRGGGVMIVIRKCLRTFRGPEVPICESLFIKVSSREHLGLLPISLLHSNIPA